MVSPPDLNGDNYKINAPNIRGDDFSICPLFEYLAILKYNYIFKILELYIRRFHSLKIWDK
jgi:hypothetical protein